VTPHLTARAVSVADERREYGRQGTILSAILVLVLSAAFEVLDLLAAGPGLPTLVRAAHILAAAAVVWLLVAQGKAAADRQIRGGFVVLILPFMPYLWLDELQMQQAGIIWQPFVGHKMVSLAVALLSPGPLVLSLGLIGALMAEASVQWWTMLAGNPRIAAGYEPWTTLITGGVACVFAWRREREFALRSRFAEARAEVEALTTLSQVFMALRDYANTPLQTLEIDLELVGRRHPEEARVLFRIRKALARLRSLMGWLTRYEARIGWIGGAASFDAEALLRTLDERLKAVASAQRLPRS
jgi:hypothetical protein